MSIVEPCVLELLKHADSRYTLVVEASKRGRQIIGGSKPLLDNEGMKPLKTAVEEINRGLITYDEPNDENEDQDAASRFTRAAKLSPVCASSAWRRTSS